MSSDYTKSLTLSLVPIAILFVLAIIYMVYKRSHTNKINKSQAESNAIIEAQAMLAKMQKEQSENKKDEDNKTEDKEEKANEQETENSDKPEKPKEDKATEEKATKPSAEAPISDTTDLEPDIDKTETK